jgi:hypothetical protein
VEQSSFAYRDPPSGGWRRSLRFLPLGEGSLCSNLFFIFRQPAVFVKAAEIVLTISVSPFVPCLHGSAPCTSLDQSRGAGMRGGGFGFLCANANGGS